MVVRPIPGEEDCDTGGCMSVGEHSEQKEKIYDHRTTQDIDIVCMY